MKRKKIIITVCAVVALAVACIGSTLHADTTKCCDEECLTLSATGKHCRGTIGCGCSGFKAIDNGKVWQAAYCKKCGHHKRYHN